MQRLTFFFTFHWGEGLACEGIRIQGATMMGCCNQAPNGGSKSLGLLAKAILGLAVVIVLLAVLFG
ncbi:hypothetical protein [Photobacterium sp. 1_MG-2023]|uniref:hypothetical protein n=1 Tax=Photobacterium sp. 1_MG-2023 TaxID=3062646 RepID=UPI0026E353C9|nr:hypothetical protein [Photobacterium sp. 1_MG-2023]